MFRIIREIVRLVPEMKSKLIQTAVLKFFESFFVGAPFGLLFLIINDLFIGALTVEKVLLYTAIAGGCFLIQGILFYVFTKISYPSGTLLQEKLRITLGEHLRKLPMSFFTERSTGDLNAMAAGEMMMLSHIPTMVFPDFVSGISLPLVIALFMVLLDWRLALVTVSVVPIAVVFLVISQRILRKAMKRRSDSLVLINSKIIEYIQGMSVVKAFKQSTKQFLKFDDTLKDFKKANLNTVLSVVPFRALFNISLDIGFTLILLSGAYYFAVGSLSVPIFLIFLIIGIRLYAPIKGLAFSLELFRVTEVTMDRVMRVLSTKPLPQPVNGRVPDNFSIEFNDVSFKYEDADVLKNVNLKIPEKAITALVGPSGSGKTTITNLIARFWDVDSGEVKIGGLNIKDIQTEMLLSKISMVFQDVYLFNDTIYQNIAYGGSNPSRDDVLEAARSAHCHEFIMDQPDGYETLVGEGGSTLSGGEKQRISIARAILKDAPIILLDEATSSVDPENENFIQEAINSLVKRKTVVIIAHRLSTITNADKIVVIDQGRIVEQGRHSELANSNGLYRKLWQYRQAARGWKAGSQQAAAGIEG